jgi:hypothetical protein
MILVDLSQVMISSLMQQVGSAKYGIDVNEDLMRHIVLNTIRSYRNRFTEKYGEIVICCDAQKYWRKDVYPYYKASRKKLREQSGIDWTVIFDVLHRVRDELEENFPYKVLRVDGAEADDIIASLCHVHGSFLAREDDEKILILSSDKDFMQLQKYVNVDQWSPSQDKFLRIDNPEKFKREHILMGDRGDGIPNFLSDDDCFVSGKRQKPLRATKIAEWQALEPESFCDEKMLRGYRRNEQLVDLDKVPNAIAEEVLNQYETKGNGREKLMNYFIKHRLQNLMEHIGEF